MNSVPNYNDIINWFASYGFTQNNIAPLIVLGLILLLANKKSIDTVKKSIDIASNRIKDVEGCVVEVQTVLRAKLENISLEQSISNYGRPGSPMVLKEDYKKFITESELDQQIETKKDDLIKWLKDKKPETGIDAQNWILSLVLSPDIEKILDLEKYKQNLYLKGKTVVDANGILAVYLFEKIIPKVIENY